MNLWLLTCALAVTPLDFDTDVLPVLSKSGCNAAACHGAADGRGGFKLSLFAGDPAADHAAIARERVGRRVNFASPAESLLIAKPSGGLEHAGGVRFDNDSDAAKLLTDWIAQGALRSGTKRVDRITVAPLEIRVPRTPLTSDQAIMVRAAFDAWQATHEERDVTPWATITADDPESIEVTRSNHLIVKRPGRHLVVVRYLSFVKVIPILAPIAAEPVEDARYAERAALDREINNVLKPLHLAPAKVADDATLARRLYLDLTGRLPTIAQAKAYVGDDEPRKYELLADTLLGSEAFNDYWAYRLGKQLRVASIGDELAEKAWRTWLHAQMEKKQPWDKMARAMLLATGDSRTYFGAPASFHRVGGDARLEAEYATESLLGIRLRCANCHNHPLDKWTQDDYHGLAAIFARLERGAVVRWIERGEVSHPVTGDVALPRLPGERFVRGDENAPEALADWVTSPSNPYFAKAMANRVWAALMGRGLVEPIDDLRDTNPGDHPAALTRLADDFVRLKYDLRGLIRSIVLSEAYRRGGAFGPIDGTERYFAKALAKPLTADVWYDAVHDVTGVPHVERAINRFGERPSADNLLGGCSRAANCEDGVLEGGGLAQRLKLLNGPLNEVVRESIKRQLSNSNAAIVEHYYWCAYARAPMYKEAAYWVSQLTATDAEARAAELEDFLWSLLNSREFTTSH